MTPRYTTFTFCVGDQAGAEVHQMTMHPSGTWYCHAVCVAPTTSHASWRAPDIIRNLRNKHWTLKAVGEE